MISEQVDFSSEEFINLCKTHQVKELYAFGSVVNGNFSEESDIDLLVEIDDEDPLRTGQLLLSLYDKFGKFFNKEIDLLTVNSIRNPILEEAIWSSRKLIYQK